MTKILIFNNVYLPGEKFGGPVTSLSNFAELFGTEYEIRVVCSDHDYRETKRYPNIEEGWNSVGNALVMYLRPEEMNYKKYLEIFKTEAPDCIYATSVMNIKYNYGVFKAAEKLGIPVLLAPRGDILNNTVMIKKWKKIPFLYIARLIGLFKNIYFQTTMKEETENVKKYLGINDKNIFEVSNLPKKPVSRIGYKKNGGELSVVFLSRISPKKNLLFAIRCINEVSYPVSFDIYGPIEDDNYWKLCNDEISKAPANVRICYKGSLKPEEASEVFGQYDCFVFPTLSENYGHVIVEALMHECPILISRNTTPWDDVSDYNAGYAVELDKPELFTEKLNEMAALDDEQYAEFGTGISIYLEKKINLSELMDRYRRMFGEISKGN